MSNPSRRSRAPFQPPPRVKTADGYRCGRAAPPPLLPPAPTRRAWTRNGSPSGGWRQGLGRGGGVRGSRCTSKHHHRPVSAQGDFGAVGVCGTSLSVGRAARHSRGGAGRRGTRRGEAWGEERRRWLGHDGPCPRVCGGRAVGLCEWSGWGVIELAAGWSCRGATGGGGGAAPLLCVCVLESRPSRAGSEWVSNGQTPGRQRVGLLRCLCLLVAGASYGRLWWWWQDPPAVRVT